MKEVVPQHQLGAQGLGRQWPLSLPHALLMWLTARSPGGSGKQTVLAPRLDVPLIELVQRLQMCLQSLEPPLIKKWGLGPLTLSLGDPP